MERGEVPRAEGRDILRRHPHPSLRRERDWRPVARENPRALLLREERHVQLPGVQGENAGKSRHGIRPRHGKGGLK